MTKILDLSIGDKFFQAELTALTVEKKHGCKKTKALDLSGNECERGYLSKDGLTVFSKSPFETLYKKGGEWADKEDVKEVNEQGEPLPMLEPTKLCDLRLSTTGSLLSVNVKNVYQVIAQGLKQEIKDKIYTSNLVLTKSTSIQKAFFIANNDNVFMLIGAPNNFCLLTNDSIPPELLEEDESGDDIDFSMF